MLTYTLQRILLFIPTLIGITIISFLIMHAAPGDPVDLFVGGAGSGEMGTDKQGDLQKTREDLRRQLGLDRPIYLQYFAWLSNLVLRAEPLDGFDRGAKLADGILAGLREDERRLLSGLDDDARKARFLDVARERDSARLEELTATPFWRLKALQGSENYQPAAAGIVLFETATTRYVTLNFGRSYKDHRAVITRIFERLPVTLEINFLALIIAYLVGLPLGIYQAVRQNSGADRALTAFTFGLWSMPSFWLGMLLIIFLCNKAFLYWFPASGMASLDASPEWGAWRLALDHAHHMVLPVLTSSYAGFAGISRYMRTSMLENLRLDYVRTARAKGLPESGVVLRHVLRNSLIPIVTLFAYLLPGMIAGSVFIETIFTVPGMGLLAFESILVRDYPIVMAIFTIGSVLSLISILLADICLKVVDPRIEFSRAGA